MASKPEAKPRGKTLTGLVGATAALALFTAVPLHESGRVVEASEDNGEVTLRHVRGNQYLTAYKDAVGIWTICDGDTENVRPGMVETPQGCRARLERQLVRHAEGVLGCTPSLRGPGRDWQRAAATSLAYNIGVGAYCRSTVKRRFEAGDMRGACDAFLMWNKAGGRVLAGLTRRREEERAMCLRGI